jgi:hypothetical protein
MRHTLVILYFAAVYYILRPAPPPEIQANSSPEPSASRPEASLTTAVAAPPKRNWDVPSRAASDPLIPAASSDTSLPATTSSSSSAPSSSSSSSPKSIVQTLAPSEQRATPHAPAEPPLEGPLEPQLQNELARLSCLIGKPEKVWGKKSRAALRRFTRRAKVKNGNLDVAMLRMLQSYPANYCKSCRPGQAACDIAVTAGGAKTGKDTGADRAGQGLNAVSAPDVPAPSGEAPATAATSYLPPWMIDGAAPNEEGAAQASEESKPARKRKKRAQRRRPSRSVSSPRRRYGAPAPYYRGSWPLGY